MRNPTAFMQEAFKNSQYMSNPMFRNGVEMLQRGDMEGLNKYVNNICKERGTNVNDVLKQFGLK